MVKIERTPILPPSLAIEKAKNGSYGEQDVIRQLRLDFHEKCYLCGMSPTDLNVEHLVAHHGDPDLKFDWDNLFFCCPHCNGMKNQKKYEKDVLDCCKTDPETVLRQELIEGIVVVTALEDTETARATAALLTDCFERRNTGTREYGCDKRAEALMETMRQLYPVLRKLRAEPSPEKSRHLRTLRGLVDRKHEFAGFTRTYVRQYLTAHPELAPLITL